MIDKKILIIDDDPEFLDEINDLLSHKGYRVTPVNDSTRAVDTANETKPDVILLDLRMKNVSGFELADRLHRNPETSSIPIIAMTGYYSIKEKSWFMDFVGINRCLNKPFKPVDVISAIENLFKDKG